MTAVIAQGVAALLAGAYRISPRENGGYGSPIRRLAPRFKRCTSRQRRRHGGR